MLSKLLKYDFKSMFKVFGPLWLALLGVSLVNRFTLGMENGGMSESIPQVVSMILYVCLVVAVLVVAVALIIMRFYQGLLKDEGYLMFTLPVKPWQLVTSKCISATVIALLSMVVGFASVFVMAANKEFFVALSELRFYWQYITGDMVLSTVLILVLMVLTIVKSITQVYASLTLGHLANSHRIGWSVAAFIGINVAFTALGLLFGNLINTLLPNFEIAYNPDSVFGVMNLGCLVLIGITLIQLVVFFVITERILSKKLNLE